LGFDNNYKHRKYFHNEDFWSIPNPVNAYWGGMSSADSSVHSRDNCPVYRMELQIGDIEHLRILKSLTSHTGNIEEINRLKMDVQDIKNDMQEIKQLMMKLTEKGSNG
jgi:hypothetical protein